MMRGGGGGEEHSYSHTVRGITHTHTPLCCCQVAACAVPWMPAMHHHLVWRTQWQTPASVIIIITFGCMPGRLPPCCCCCCCYYCDVCCHRERRGEAVRSRCHEWYGVAGCEQHVPCWHQQTTQHSKGKGRGGAATRTVTHPPPLSHQHKQAATSLELLARGRCCGCVKHPFLPLHQHTLAHTHTW